MSFNSLLNIEVTIKELTQAQQSNGEVTTSLSTLASNVKSRKNIAGSTGVAFSDYKLSTDSYKFYFKPTQPYLVPKNVIVDASGNTYEIIQAVLDGSEHHYEVLAEKKHYD